MGETAVTEVPDLLFHGFLAVPAKTSTNTKSKLPGDQGIFQISGSCFRTGPGWI